MAWKISPQQFLSDSVRKALDGVASGANKAGVLHSTIGQVPAHLRTISTEHGTVLYNPAKIKARGIRRAIKFKRFHEISGLNVPSPLAGLSKFKFPKGGISA